MLACLNQTSLIDQWFLLACGLGMGEDVPSEIRDIANLMRRPHFIFANIEYLMIPLLGWLIWLTGAVYVVRQWKAQGTASFFTFSTF